MIDPFSTKYLLYHHSKAPCWGSVCELLHVVHCHADLASLGVFCLFFLLVFFQPECAAPFNFEWEKLATTKKNIQGTPMCLNSADVLVLSLLEIVSIYCGTLLTQNPLFCTATELLLQEVAKYRPNYRSEVFTEEL